MKSSRRQFLAALPACAAFAQTKPLKISAIEIVELHGHRDTVRGADQQFQANPLFIYDDLRPAPYRDSANPVTAKAAIGLVGRPDIALIDLRERTEREKSGVIPGSLHAPYPDLAANVQPGGMLHGLASATGKRLLFYCAFGERSAMAVQAAQDAGIATACHIHGGIDAWKKEQGPLVR